MAKMTDQEIVAEVDYQMAEYDCYESDAIENVADYLGISFAECQRRYIDNK